MTFKNEINLQIENNKKLSYEFLQSLNNKTYTSGREKVLGDTVLFGMLDEGSDGDNKNFTLITFHKDEVGVLYTESEEYYKDGDKKTKFPIVKKI